MHKTAFKGMQLNFDLTANLFVSLIWISQVINLNFKLCVKYFSNELPYSYR